MLKLFLSMKNGVKKHFQYQNPFTNQSKTKIFADDVTKMNQTRVNKIFTAKNEKDIQNIIKLAKKNGKKISIRGQSHTMGGQTLCEDCYLIDMKYMKKLNYDQTGKILHAEPGATWGDAIRYLNLHGQSPDIMQSYCSFSIGGTISVNAHGKNDEIEPF
jgi:decaprenylphospho-beta-D-ribofuranose 2-oxidase